MKVISCTNDKNYNYQHKKCLVDGKHFPRVCGIQTFFFTARAVGQCWHTDGIELMTCQHVNI